MRAKRFVFSATLLGLVFAGLPETVSASAGCVPTDAEEMMAAGRAHLEATMHPEKALDVPLADDARQTELPPTLPRELGGAIRATSGPEIRALYNGPTLRLIRGYGDLRWVLDVAHCEATVFFLIDFDAPGIPFTIHIAERFRVSSGLIEDIEITSWRANGHDGGSCWPAGNNPDEGRNGPCHQDMTTTPYGPTPDCESGSRDQTISVAQRYIDALASHDASSVPLAEGARRTEKPPPSAGPVTGTSSSEIAASLQDDQRFQGIVGVRDVRWFVDAQRCQATAFYLVDGDLTDPNRKGSRHHATRFLVSDGLIHEIEDVWRSPIDPTKFEGSCWPQTWSDQEDETYRVIACPA